MSITQKLVDSIFSIFAPIARRFEGVRKKAYLCPAKVPTQGIGHTGDDVKLDGPEWSDEKVDQVFHADGARFIRQALSLSPNLAGSPPRAAAITDFCFNLGSTRYKASTLRRKVREANWPEAAREIRKWVWGGGRKLPGLVARREVEAALLTRG